LAPPRSRPARSCPRPFPQSSRAPNRTIPAPNRPQRAPPHPGGREECCQPGWVTIFGFSIQGWLARSGAGHQEDQRLNSSIAACCTAPMPLIPGLLSLARHRFVRRLGTTRRSTQRRQNAWLTAVFELPRTSATVACRWSIRVHGAKRAANASGALILYPNALGIVPGVKNGLPEHRIPTLASQYLGHWPDFAPLHSRGRWADAADGGCMPFAAGWRLDPASIIEPRSGSFFY
jgi:hypothetical protein